MSENVRFVEGRSEMGECHFLEVDGSIIARMQWVFDVPEEREKALERARSLFGVGGTMEIILD